MFFPKTHFYIYLLLIILAACTSSEQKKEEGQGQTCPTDSCPLNKVAHTKQTKSSAATYMDSLGLVNLADLDSSIVVRLMYANADNFTGRILYKNLREAYLQTDAAKALLLAHSKLKEKHPGYRFVVYDAARPLSVQRQMWDVVKNSSKSIYVSNPQHGGGLHNYGLAVDISILDSLGNPLSMGTKVDHLGSEAHITNEKQLVSQQIITEKERKNRVLLRQVMKEAGFRTLPTEWWHFNFCSRREAFRKYRVIP